MLGQVATISDLSKQMSRGYILYSDGLIAWMIDTPEPRGKGTRTAISVDSDFFKRLINDHIVGALQSVRNPTKGYYKIGWRDIGLPDPPVGWHYYLFVQ